MKLEHISNKAIFLGPKTYYLETVEGKQIKTVKGLAKEGKHKLNYEIFKELLYKI
jgi:hypothetical protein